MALTLLALALLPVQEASAHFVSNNVRRTSSVEAAFLTRHASRAAIACRRSRRLLSSKLSPPPSDDGRSPEDDDDDDTDWFTDGREAARRLKLELGIAEDGDGDDGDTAADDDGAPSGSDLATSEGASSALEAGRAAARALLRTMEDAESEEGGVDVDAAADDRDATASPSGADPELERASALEAGRSAARALLRTMEDAESKEGGVDVAAPEDGDATASPSSAGPEESERASALEAGRAAARALLRTMEDNAESEGEIEVVAGDDDLAPRNERPSGSISSESSDGNSAKKNTSGLPREHFDFPSKKSGYTAVCIVPPPSASEAWEALTAVRTACRDRHPGFFWWPPHANLLYPFLEPDFKAASQSDSKDDGNGSGNEGGSTETRDEIRLKFREEVTRCLGRAASQCPPFDVVLDSFVEKGDKRRGVLWALPKSKWAGNDDGELPSKDDPLIYLQQLLFQQFQQLKGGGFGPCVTISHYKSESDASDARAKLEASWERISFPVSKIYLMQLSEWDDDGAFKIAATVPLGGDDSPVEIHDPPISFPAMPSEEESSVREERTKLTRRRKNRSRSKARRRKAKEEAKYR